MGIDQHRHECLQLSSAKMPPSMTSVFTPSTIVQNRVRVKSCTVPKAGCDPNDPEFVVRSSSGPSVKVRLAGLFPACRVLGNTDRCRGAHEIGRELQRSVMVKSVNKNLSTTSPRSLTSQSRTTTITDCNPVLHLCGHTVKS